MAESVFSASWYRVARLKPRLRSHVRFHRHHYRGNVWYVLQDHTTGRCHRLTPTAYHLAGLMNGKRSTQEIWDAVSTQLGDDGPTQDETIRLLGLLHAANLLQSDVPPDTVEIFRRSQRRESAEWWRRVTNPLSVRFPLLDPGRFLDRGLPWVQPLFSWPGAIVWGVTVVSAFVVGLVNWPELSEGTATQLLSPQNLLLMAVVYPVLKALHELGHAFATRVWGCEVHEMGILFLVLMPVPYVDASAASVFSDKWKRVAVGGAGIMVELFLASLALFTWLLAEPGAVRAVAYNVMWIGAASTFLFNGNPLVRFDGYYVLSDAVEIPNLSPRSTQYYAYLVLRYLFGLDQVRYPVTARGEEWWFAVYGAAAFFYRLAVLFGIAVFLAGRFFVVGVALAVFAVVTQIAVPLLRQATWVLTSPRIQSVRARALLTSGGVVAAVAALFLVVPVPLFTRAEGVVWPPEDSQVRARADGFVLQVLAPPDSTVAEGDPLILTRDPTLEARVAMLASRVRELQARYYGERQTDLVRAQITQDEIGTVQASLADARERVGDVVIRSPAAGIFVVPRAADLPGRFVEQGGLMGYVVGPAVATVRVVVPQSQASLVRERTEAVDVRLSPRVGQVLPARIQREVPAATGRLPSRALGTSGGGRLPVDPADADGLRTLEPFFQLDLALPRDADVGEIGGRVYVRFDHGSEPMALRTYRSLRRLFLRRIGV
jgi:putative peptide zinc metalloprotease protein